MFLTTYTANIAAGDEHVLAEYTVQDPSSSCDGQSATAQFRAIVEVPGLAQIPDHADVTKNPPTSHVESVFWYLTPEGIDSTVRLGVLHRR